MFREYNAHPKGLKTTDCSVRAFATALNKDYLECRRELNQIKKVFGFKSYKDHEFVFEYLKDYPRLKFKAVKGEPRLKGSGFTELYPKGTYVLSMTGHLTCCKDGVILDIWDCSYLTVYTAWEIKNKKEMN